jgi:hypothetical protein
VRWARSREARWSPPTHTEISIPPWVRGGYRGRAGTLSVSPRACRARRILSRADSATLTRLEPLELGRWLTRYLESRPQDLRSADITIGEDQSTGSWVKAQPHLLARLLENLLDNADFEAEPAEALSITPS